MIPWLRRFPGEENGNPLQYSCLEHPMNRGAWRATVHRVAKSWNDWATNLYIQFSLSKFSKQIGALYCSLSLQIMELLQISMPSKKKKRTLKGSLINYSSYSSLIVKFFSLHQSTLWLQEFSQSWYYFFTVHGPQGVWI